MRGEHDRPTITFELPKNKLAAEQLGWMIQSMLEQPWWRGDEPPFGNLGNTVEEIYTGLVGPQPYTDGKYSGIHFRQLTDDEVRAQLANEEHYREGEHDRYLNDLKLRYMGWCVHFDYTDSMTNEFESPVYSDDNMGGVTLWEM